MDVYVGIDVGTTNLKVAAFDRHWQLTAYHSEPTPWISYGQGRGEMDPMEMWERIKTGIQRVREKTGGDFRSIGVSSMGEAGILCDKGGNPLYPFISWFDTRPEEELAGLLKKMDKRVLFDITGQIPSVKYGLLKLMWLKGEYPELYKRAAHWLSVEDWVIFCLTGEYVTDYSIASRTMAFDVGRLRWSESIIKTAGLCGELFPRALPGGTPVGKVRREIAEELGISLETMISTGGHDHACAAVAVNILEEGTALDSMGTAEVLMTAAKEPLLNDETYGSHTSVYPHCGERLYRMVTSNQSCGVCVEWYINTFGGHMCREGALKGMSPYELFNETGEQAASGSSVMFFPFLRGAVDNPHIKGTFWGLGDTDREGDYVRAIIDGLGFELRAQLEGYKRQIPGAGRRVKVVGGPSKSAFLMARKALTQNCDLEVPLCSEAACKGAAVLGAVGAGDMDFAHLSSVYEKGPEYKKPREDVMGKRYENYKKIKKAIGRIYRSIDEGGGFD